MGHHISAGLEAMKARRAGASNCVHVLSGRDCPRRRRPGEQDAPALGSRRRQLRDAFAFRPLETQKQPIHFADEPTRAERQELPRQRIELGGRRTNRQNDWLLRRECLGNLVLPLHPSRRLDKGPQALAHALQHGGIASWQANRFQVCQHLLGPLKPRGRGSPSLRRKNVVLWLKVKAIRLPRRRRAC